MRLTVPDSRRHLRLARGDHAHGGTGADDPNAPRRLLFAIRSERRICADAPSNYSGNEVENVISPGSTARKSEVAERNHGSKFRSASTDWPSSADAGLADAACNLCDQAWHCQPSEGPLARVMPAPLWRARSRNEPPHVAGSAQSRA